MDESVYNLIPKESSQEEPRRSKPSKPATKETNLIKVPPKRAAASMGPAKVQVRKPTEFLKKGEAAKNVPQKCEFETNEEPKKKNHKAILYFFIFFQAHSKQILWSSQTPQQPQEKRTEFLLNENLQYLSEVRNR
jgi:hypothetical protein